MWLLCTQSPPSEADLLHKGHAKCYADRSRSHVAHSTVLFGKRTMDHEKKEIKRDILRTRALASSGKSAERASTRRRMRKSTLAGVYPKSRSARSLAETGPNSWGAPWPVESLIALPTLLPASVRDLPAGSRFQNAADRSSRAGTRGIRARRHRAFIWSSLRTRTHVRTHARKAESENPALLLDVTSNLSKRTHV